MSDQEKRQMILARDVEEALAEYMGLPCFNSEDFPKVAETFASLVAATDVTKDYAGASEVGYNAQHLAKCLAEFQAALANVVE